MCTQRWRERERERGGKVVVVVVVAQATSWWLQLTTLAVISKTGDRIHQSLPSQPPANSDRGSSRSKRMEDMVD